MMGDQQRRPPGLYQAPSLSLPEQVYRTLVEPLLGQTPQAQLPPPGQMPGQPVPSQQGPGVSDVLKLAAVPAAGMYGVAPLALGALGSSVMGEAGGRLGEQVGGLGGKEWGARGRQVGEALGQFAIPGEKAPQLDPRRYDPYRIKRPEVELPPQEELQAIARYGTEEPKKPVRGKMTQPLENLDPYAVETMQLGAQRRAPVESPYVRIADEREPSEAMTNRLLTFNPNRPPVSKREIQISGLLPEQQHIVRTALDTLSTQYPNALSTIENIRVVPPDAMQGASGSYSPDHRRIRLDERLVDQAYYPQLVETIAHELHHHAQFSSPLRKALELDRLQAQGGMAQADKIEPSAYGKGREVGQLLGRAMDMDPPMSTAQRKNLRQQGERDYLKVRPFYVKASKKARDPALRTLLGEE